MTVRAPRNSLLVLGGLILAGLLAATAGGAPAVDSQTAIAAGNRLFRNGQIEEAVAAYLAGYCPGTPRPTLFYNLGTALHHSGRLPEAVLWYRRAAPSEDPWLRENLWLARRSLGSRSLMPGGLPGWLSRHAQGLRLAAIAVAWLTLLGVILKPRIPVWAVIAAALLAGSLYAAAADRWGPSPAVILKSCFTAAGELPAGTEVWVQPTDDGRWRIAGSHGRSPEGGQMEISCPVDAVELVFPP